jgi:23S rRNA (uracil1939-C5)-methyltransferase/tRNA (uracil-5-)-methyltransferase
VYGVEVSDLAVRAAEESARINKIKNVQFVAGSSEAIFLKVKHLERSKTVIVLDPPRKGCDSIFLSQLFEFSPKLIVYVSCDPATQARDAKEIINAGYDVIDITPFDLFPQTRHIENVMSFLKQPK